MADFEVTGPDGNSYQVTAPDGATQDQVLDYAKQHFGDLPHSMAPIQKDNAGLPVDPMNAGERFAAGALDPVFGGKQIYAHTLGGNADEVDKGIRDRETDLKSRGAGEGDIMRSVGRATPAVAAGLAATPIAGGVIGSALGGAASELLNPVSKGNYAEEKMNQGLMGAAFGAFGGAATKGIGSIVGPTVRESAEELMKQGVQLTPGQIAGGILRRAEEAAKSFPVLGSFIRGSEQRSVEGFNRAVINQALEPIGEKLPERANVGREAISYAKARLDDAYDTLLPKMHLTLDQPLANDIANIRFQASSGLPPQQFEQFDRAIKDRAERYFNNTGSIPGDELKKIERDLGSIARSYSSSSDGAQREMAYALNDVRGAVRDALIRQNPTEAPQLQKINESYAMFTRVEAAAGRRVSDKTGSGTHGVFLPSDLLQSIKQADKTVRRGAFARGDALMQDFAEYGDTVLPSKMPDSGTTERAMWDYMMSHGGGVAATGAGALFAPKAAVVVGGGILPYTKLGSKVVNAVAQPGPTRQAAGLAIKASTPAVGSALEPILHEGSMDYMAHNE